MSRSVALVVWPSLRAVASASAYRSATWSSTGRAANALARVLLAREPDQRAKRQARLAQVRAEGVGGDEVHGRVERALDAGG